MQALVERLKNRLVVRAPVLYWRDQPRDAQLCGQRMTRGLLSNPQIRQLAGSIRSAAPNLTEVLLDRRDVAMANR